jgi:hypothetical protein
VRPAGRQRNSNSGSSIMPRWSWLVLCTTAVLVGAKRDSRPGAGRATAAGGEEDRAEELEAAVVRALHRGAAGGGEEAAQLFGEYQQYLQARIGAVSMPEGVQAMLQLKHPPVSECCVAGVWAGQGLLRTPVPRLQNASHPTQTGGVACWQQSFYEIMTLWLDSFVDVDAFYAAQEALILARLKAHEKAGRAPQQLFERFSEEPVFR